MRQILSQGRFLRLPQVSAEVQGGTEHSPGEAAPGIRSGARRVWADCRDLWISGEGLQAVRGEPGGD